MCASVGTDPNIPPRKNPYWLSELSAKHKVRDAALPATPAEAAGASTAAKGHLWTEPILLPLLVLLQLTGPRSRQGDEEQQGRSLTAETLPCAPRRSPGDLALQPASACRCSCLSPALPAAVETPQPPESCSSNPAKVPRSARPRHVPGRHSPQRLHSKPKPEFQVSTTFPVCPCQAQSFSSFLEPRFLTEVFGSPRKPVLIIFCPHESPRSSPHVPWEVGSRSRLSALSSSASPGFGCKQQGWTLAHLPRKGIHWTDGQDSGVHRKSGGPRSEQGALRLRTPLGTAMGTVPGAGTAPETHQRHLRSSRGLRLSA